MASWIARLLCGWLGILVIAGDGWPAVPLLRFRKPAEQPQISVEAYSGVPFGVGKLTVALPAEELPEPLGADGLKLSEKDRRVVYPVFHTPQFGAVAKEVIDTTGVLEGGPIRKQIKGIVREVLDRPPHSTAYFLFVGDGPLQLTLHAKGLHTVTVTPRNVPRLHRKTLEAWWEQYSAPPGLLEPKADYPPLVENYLRATLARRLDFRLPKQQQRSSPRELFTKELGLFFGSESILLAIEQDRLLGLHNLGLPADQPLPNPINPPALELPPVPSDVPVEPIATRVPQECYYIRFGSFNNFLWLQDTLALWGGDAYNLIGVRGLDYSLNDKVQTQLALETTVLARLLGEAVIADVALIGTDTFFREGAAYGLLFQARNNPMLTANLLAQRAEKLKTLKLQQQKLDIGGRAATYLYSPDGSVRSYYVADGEFHFVTTSRTLAERFVQVRSGEGSLGLSQEFRYARSLMPLANNYTVWAYFSDAFFRNLLSPRYRIEMMRRLQAQADIECVQLAVLAAAAEGKSGSTIEQLVAGALLPPDFGPRPDGSRAVLEAGEAYDSLRGHRGALLPVPDVPVTTVTSAEATEYRQFAEFFGEHWGRLDPLVIGLRRQPQKDRLERLLIDIRFCPLADKHLQSLSRMVGPPTTRRIAAVPGDIAQGQIVLKEQHIFAGLRDFGPSPELLSVRSFSLGRVRDLFVGYIGTTGRLGLLGFLEGPLSWLEPGVPAERLKPPVRAKTGDFTVFSFHPEVLREVVPQLRLEEAPTAAQLRLWIGDVSKARIAPLINHIGYTRTLDSSLGNLRLMHTVEQQLHVPPESCRLAAEFLTGARLHCPLGGQYVLRKTEGQSAYWTSTELEGTGRSILLGAVAPQGYVAPPMDWFRGLKMEAIMTSGQLSAQVELLMQLPEKPRTQQRKQPAAEKAPQGSRATEF